VYDVTALDIATSNRDDQLGKRKVTSQRLSPRISPWEKKKMLGLACAGPI
jgi:hypothetical protein